MTTVYPGYIRTPIHDAAAERGPHARGRGAGGGRSAAAATLVRAALGPAARDLATTRRGTVGYALLRLLPRRLVDRLVWRKLRRGVAAGRFDESKLAADLRRRLAA